MTKRVSPAAGFGLLEIVVAAAIISITTLSFTQVGRLALRVSRVAAERTEATFLLQESAEAVRWLRDNGWSANIGSLSNGTSYDLAFTGSAWMTTTTLAAINGTFFRTIVPAEVRRDAGTDDIDPLGVVDPATRRFTATVSWWTGNGTSSESVEWYLTDLFQN